jgi:cytochrome oxidase assembly protein ShyY1
MLLLAAAWMWLCVFAGHWQWGRYVERSTHATAIAEHYEAQPAPLTSVLPTPASTISAAGEWTRVSATGRYDGPARVLVRTRNHSQGLGFELLVPLHTSQGTLVVDRGWLPYPATSTDLPDIPAPPEGEVTVTGWLVRSENPVDRALPGRQIATVSTAQVAEMLGGPVYAPYLVLDSESPTPAMAAVPLDPPTPDLGPHQAYAIQWWLFSIFGFVFIGVGVRNEAAAARVARLGDDTEPTVDGMGVVDVPVGARPPTRSATAPAKPKKVRIWDEEDW